MKYFTVLIAAILLQSCNRPEPNYEGVLMTDYGRNGIESFKVVTGAQGLLGPDIVLAYKNYNVGRAEQFFDAIEENIINKRVTDAYREEARGYTTDSLMNNLTGYENAVESRLKKEFISKFFELTTLTSGLRPPTSMANAIENRNKAVQEANQVENQLKTSEVLKRKAVIDAETNRINSQGLTKEVLAEKWIDAIRNSSNRIIITDGKTPIMLQQ